ncbi:MAG: 6-bladed beta-propeller [Gemmatimonadetes bacterium]|nr:6-bladed beta-propeller [Gemmatimonadota bacterium]
MRLPPVVASLFDANMRRCLPIGRRHWERAAVLAVFCVAVPFPASGQMERWTLERTITIGDAMGSEAGLTRVGTVIVRDDRLIVTQPRERRLRIFSLIGDFLGFIGRDGEGPGEFRAVGRMGLLADGRLWVHDPQLQRIQHFDLAGRVVSTERVRDHPALRGWGSVRGLLEDGSQLVWYSASSSELVKSPQLPEPVVRFPEDGQPPDTVAMIVGRNDILALSDGTAGVRVLALHPLSYRSRLAVGADGSGFVVVHRTGATSDERHTYSVIGFDGRADTAWVREVPYDPVRIPEGWRQRRVEERIGYPDRLHPSVSERHFRNVLKRAYGGRAFFPPVELVVRAAAEGTTWLRLRTGVESSEWEVLDKFGRSVARVDLPRGSINWIGRESVWVTERDELDISYLVRYVIHRP